MDELEYEELNDLEYEELNDLAVKLPKKNTSLKPKYEVSHVDASKKDELLGALYALRGAMSVATVKKDELDAEIDKYTSEKAQTDYATKRKTEALRRVNDKYWSATHYNSNAVVFWVSSIINLLISIGALVWLFWLTPQVNFLYYVFEIGPIFVGVIAGILPCVLFVWLICLLADKIRLTRKQTGFCMFTSIVFFVFIDMFLVVWVAGATNYRVDYYTEFCYQYFGMGYEVFPMIMGILIAVQLVCWLICMIIGKAVDISRGIEAKQIEKPKLDAQRMKIESDFQKELKKIAMDCAESKKRAIVLFADLKKYIKMMDEQFVFLSKEDWKHVDLIIFYLTSRRADTLKESLYQVDRQSQTDAIVGEISRATNMVCSTIGRGLATIGEGIEQSFSRISNQLTSQHQERLVSERESNRLMIESVQKMSDRTCEEMASVATMIGKVGDNISSGLNYFRY